MTEVSPGSERVSLLIGAPVASVEPGATLQEVADSMTSASVGALVVRTGRGTVVGVVSERDLVRALAGRRDPVTTAAEQLASTELVWCDVDATIAEVAEQMMDRYIRHVLVERRGHLVGIVSARDILGAYATADPDPDSGTDSELGAAVRQ